MAFSPAKTLQGITRHSKVSEHMIVWAPGVPGVTYTKGKAVIRGSTAATDSGLVQVASDSSARALGRVHKTVVCPAAAGIPFPLPGTPPLDLDGSEMKTLIPIELTTPPVGTQILKGRAYVNALDETVAGFVQNSSYTVIGLTTGCGADNRCAGSLVYVYEGPGKGECNVIWDYDHAGHGSGQNLAAIMTRPFKTTLTTSSKLLIFGNNGAANDGIGPIGALMDLDEAAATTSEFDVSDGYDDGNYVTLMDWWMLGGLMADGAFLAYQRIDSP